ncbi:hypothetical protein M9H77_13372 [Catharanthus roseus]|uniref:Uncharacterized protein n=1 Tax=Catharanthus roseus TaxID=4058 RepID=A0ACC0BK64_CATRO|nr:hypothetical protein M9H77_13372 [Catharanthus roseus]
MTNSYYFIIILGIIIIWFQVLPSTNYAQITTCNNEISLMNHTKMVLVKELHSNRGQGNDFETTTNLRSTRTRRPRRRQGHLHLRTVHGIVNIIGWGILLPIGVLAARYLKKLPLDLGSQWYSVHVLSQISGFILGTIGWGLGFSIHRAAKDPKRTMSLHGIIGTLIFALAAIQVCG